MGNAPSAKERQDDTVDFGALAPQGGVYTGPQDWNHNVVGHLIVDRKLAPFYRPLEDYEEEWDDEKIMAARKEDPNAPSPTNSVPAAPSHSKAPPKSPTRSSKDPQRITEVQVYRGAVECPICFLVSVLFLFPSMALVAEILLFSTTRPI